MSKPDCHTLYIPAVVLSALLSLTAFSQPQQLWTQVTDDRRSPPSWDLRDPVTHSAQDDDSAVLRENKTRGHDASVNSRDAQSRRRRSRPWYIPRAALGAGLNFPELVPLEGYLFFGRYFALRGFYAPPIPINIRVEMPSDVITARAKQGYAVANPAYTIRAKAIYGASYGAEALVFPFAGSFYLGLGASYREMRLHGQARSSALVCSLIEAAKEPPCGDPDASVQTLTQLDVVADARTSAILLRNSMGWFWHISSFGYLSLSLGITKPTRVNEHVKITTNLISPSGDLVEFDEALSELKAGREEDLEDKALKEMRPTGRRLLPILGLAAGIRF